MLSERGGVTLEDDFREKLRRLELWHSDAVKAQDFSGPQTSHTKPGSVELRVTPYPHRSYWQNEWRKAKGDEGREEVIRGLDDEWDDLALSPSKKHAFTQRTLEWKVAIGSCDLPAKHTARLYGVGLSTVYKYRNQHGNSTA